MYVSLVFPGQLVRFLNRNTEDLKGGHFCLDTTRLTFESRGKINSPEMIFQSQITLSQPRRDSLNQITATSTEETAGIFSLEHLSARAVVGTVLRHLISAPNAKKQHFAARIVQSRATAGVFGPGPT